MTKFTRIALGLLAATPPEVIEGIREKQAKKKPKPRNQAGDKIGPQ